MSRRNLHRAAVMLSLLMGPGAGIGDRTAVRADSSQTPAASPSKPKPATAPAAARTGTPSEPRPQGAVPVKIVAADPLLDTTPEREALAESFARQHHPELAELLSRLRVKGQDDYHNAVRAIAREHDRLARLQGRDPARHAIELDLWKINSRIQLSAARLAMGDDPLQRDELLAMLQTRLSVKTRLLRLEREKMTARLEKIEADLSGLDTDHAVLAERELDQLLKSARPRAQVVRQRSASGPRSRTDDSSAAPNRARPAPIPARPRPDAAPSPQ